ncbi:MAG: VTT domain-containing protein [Patescibacteria group bacterium]
MNTKYLYILFLVAAITGLFWYSDFLQEIFYDFSFLIIGYIEEHPLWGMAIFISLAAVSAMFSPFSSVPLVPAAIMVWGIALTSVFLLIGWLIGYVITYFIGYYAGYPVAKQFLPFDKIDYYKSRISKKSEFWFILLFRMAMPAEIPGYVLGIIRYDFWKYFFASLATELPFVIIVVYASEAFITRDILLFSGLALLGFMILAIMFYAFHKIKLERD